MPIEERRRAQLQAAATESWGEEAADTLMELVTPAGQEMATRADIQGVLTAIDALDQRLTGQLAAMDARWDERLAASDERWLERLAASDEHIRAMHERWAEQQAERDARWDARQAASDQRWSQRLDALDELSGLRAEKVEERVNATVERGINEAITAQTRSLVLSVLVAVAAIAALAFGVAG